MSSDDRYVASEVDSKHSQATENIAKSDSSNPLVMPSTFKTNKIDERGQRSRPVRCVPPPVPHLKKATLAVPAAVSADGKDTGSLSMTEPTSVSQDYSDVFSDNDRNVTSEVDLKNSQAAENITKSNSSNPYVVPSTFQALKTDNKDEEGQGSGSVRRAPPSVPLPKKVAPAAPAAATVKVGGQDTGSLSMTELMQAIGKGKEDKKKQQQPVSITAVRVAPTPPTQHKAREGGKDLEPATFAARPRPVPSTKAEIHELQVMPPVASTLKPVPPIKPKPEDPDKVATVSKAKPVPPVKPKPEDPGTVVTVSKLKPVLAVKPKPEDLDTVVTVSKAKPVPAVKPKPENLDTVVAVSKVKSPPVKPTATAASEGGKPQLPIKPKVDTVTTASKMKLVPPVKPTSLTTSDKSKPRPPVKPSFTLPPAESGGSPSHTRPKPAPHTPVAVGEVQGQPPSHPPKPVAKPRVSAKRVGEVGSVADGGRGEDTRVSVERFGEHVASLHADYNDEFISQFYVSLRDGGGVRNWRIFKLLKGLS